MQEELPLNLLSLQIKNNIKVSGRLITIQKQSYFRAVLDPYRKK